VRERIARGDEEIPVEVEGNQIMTMLEISDLQRKYLLAGGAMNFAKNNRLE
jgi:aconitate hydratase